MNTPQSPADGLTGYLAAMDTDGAPLLGHLVLYSVYEGTVTCADCQRWFTDLGLDPAFVPAEIRPVDVFEKITGPSGIRRAYPLGEPARRHRRRRDGPKGREATLMPRHVSRGSEKIVRHLVREVRDEQATALSYDPLMAQCEFIRDAAAGDGAGTMQITPNQTAITALPEPEQEQVREVLVELQDAFDRGRTYLTSDRLRASVRGYIESLNAIKVRPTGGVYFTGRQHAQVLGQLRELVSRFGHGSNLTRIPLPDQQEMRDMVVAAFLSRASEDLDKLTRDLAAALRDGAGPATVAALHTRFRELQTAATEHADLLGDAVNAANDRMQLVNMQLTSLLLAQAS